MGSYLGTQYGRRVKSMGFATFYEVVVRAAKCHQLATGWLNKRQTATAHAADVNRFARLDNFSVSLLSHLFPAVLDIWMNTAPPPRSTQLAFADCLLHMTPRTRGGGDGALYRSRRPPLSIIYSCKLVHIKTHYHQRGL